ncbi:MAG: excinuclease ABC subunit UvrA [Actinobacteria bacterium]|nr:MAG: excinuclease ABC subunit UvrA [Actinomycetota bacterium]
MNQDKIIIKGAREHNLKNVSLEIPRDKLVVMTGLSGSGKSSLAFDTIYAEGQRRYVESLSAYARQFLGQMQKPEVDHIDGLSPAISIDQKSTSRNPRSTVGTVTEIYDYLRLLYARIGVPHCYKCGKEISRQTAQQIVDQILKLPKDSKFQILAPVVRGRKGEYQKLFEEARREGFSRVRVDGQVRDLDEEIELKRYEAHNIDIVVDRLVMKEGINKRLTDSVELALKVTDGMVTIDIIEGDSLSHKAMAEQGEITLSEQFACLKCGISYEELTPRMFSFNSPYGACPTCTGLGQKKQVDAKLLIPNPNLSIKEGAIEPFYSHTSHIYPAMIEAVCKEYGIDINKPYKDLPKKHQNIILYGADRTVLVRYHNMGGDVRNWKMRYEGAIGTIERRYQQTDSDYARDRMEQYMSVVPCQECGGARLKPESLAVTVGSKNIAELTMLSSKAALDYINNLKLTERQQLIGVRIIKEIKERLNFLVDVGLDYITLDRAAGTLSGGEAQRIRLATQIGSGLMGVLYILDEPSIGLHQRDNQRLINTLVRLKNLGNTVIVVEHDEATIRSADHIIDIGPGAGIHGGKIVAEGSLSKITKQTKSITGRYLSGKEQIELPLERLAGNGHNITIKEAAEHNLKEIDVDIPLGLFVCVTGVSGSGKSTLVVDILSKALYQRFYKSRSVPGSHKDIEGLENIDKVIEIDQSPIGRTPRSNPATYTKVFDEIRKVFAAAPEAKIRGYQPGRFSFNVKGGRCEACQGEGTIKIEMHFLPDIYIPCEECKGKRYNRETLEVKFKGKTIADVLSMNVEQALDFFKNIPSIRRKLQTIYDVGLGYIELGQPAPTLSGGEAQRVKLSTELSKRSTGRTFYILDEPTTGLHFHDIKQLLDVLKRLVAEGNTVLVIEHNLDVIKNADHIIDLGPEGGDAGGKVIATGTPEQIAKTKGSYTGKFLKDVL